jgi:predicted nucleotidyltransferase
LWAIREWAAHTRYVDEVRLFGSRAKGNAKPGSDVDLAITVGGSDPGNILGNYFAESQRWQDELTKLIEAKAHVALYNDADRKLVRRACDECSMLLYPTEAASPHVAV